MTRTADPRGASRRGGTDAADLGYTVANDAAQTARQFLSRKPRTLPYTGCHLYQGPSVWFPGTQQVYSRCPAHQPAGSIDLGPVGGYCTQCMQSPEFQAPVFEALEY